MSKYTIIVRSFYNAQDEVYATAATITPGHLIERTSAGKVQKHSTAGGAAQKMFAFEDANQGKKITDDYVASSLVQVWTPGLGDRVYAIFDSTSGGSLADGDFLESAGDGTLRKWTAPASGGIVELPNSIIAVAKEAVATPGNRFVCEII